LLYTSTITSGALRLRESRVIAALVLDVASADSWQHTLYQQNALQLRSTESIKRVAGLLRARLTTLDTRLLELARSGERDQAIQVLLVGAIKHSRLLGDFMDLVIREKWAGFDAVLNSHTWDDYLEGCRARDPAMPAWSDSTRKRLRSSVYSILAETGYLENTRSLALKRVFIDPTVKRLLEETSEKYALRCLEVTT